MRFQYLIGLLRKLARRSGVVALLQFPKSVWHNRRLARWRGHEGDELTITVAGRDATFRVRNEREFVVAHKLIDDDKLISALGERCRPGMVFWDIGASVGGIRRYCLS